MNKLFLFLGMLLGSYGMYSQQYQQLDTIHPPASYENIFTRPLYQDSLVSSFVIFIKKEVPRHKHLTHAEHVYFLEGEGIMKLGEQEIRVKKGSMIFIPAGIYHSLTVSSKKPAKVLSVQAPFFDGKDRHK